MATGITAKERMAASSWVRVPEAALGLALRRLSPSSVPSHWNSWEAFDDYHDEEINCFMKQTPRLNALMTTMKQFYRVKHSINTLNNKNNKAKRNKE